ASNNLGNSLKQLNIGRTAGDVFVDNYTSIVGVPYRNASDAVLSKIIDVQLQPDTINPLVAHGYPIEWYAKATNVPGTQDGLAWSPALGSGQSALDFSYRQDWQSLPGIFQNQYETRLSGFAGGVLNGFAFPASVTITSAQAELNTSDVATVHAVSPDTIFT